MKKPLSVLILAAGLGTRMKSKRAKVLHRAGGRTLVEQVVGEALKLTAAERITVVTGHQAEAVESQLAPYGVRFARQTEQLGTGHAVRCCDPGGDITEGKVLILYGDCPLLRHQTLVTLLAQHEKERNAATLIWMRLDDPTGYGRVLMESTDAVLSIVEQKAANAEQLCINAVNSGIYCFEAAHLWPLLRSLRPNPASGEYYLTDLVEILSSNRKRVGGMEGEDPSELMGINTRPELVAADRVLRKRKVDELLVAGVTIYQPETVRIDLTVSVGQDTIIEPFTQLLGHTRIGAECTIGSGSVLQNATLGDAVTVHPYSLIADSELADSVSVGPFARIRLHASIETGAAIGNFVEVKKSKIGPKTKAMHLAYLGDAVIGSAVNVGAGTITCNYDGVQKHETRIEEGCFVGSNSTLVAPVTIGHGSYVAAGSVITKNVDPDSLALGRALQIQKDGWAAKRRQVAAKATS